MDKNIHLTNFIKYCLGYIRITRERTVAAQQKKAVNLFEEHLDLLGLLNGDTDGKLEELINLQTFYKYEPKKVPEEEVKKYEEEKDLANKIEDIYNNYKNNQFIKQIVLNFGYFKIELPLDTESEDEQDEEDSTKIEAGDKNLEKTKIDTYPLFAFPIRIEKEITKTGVGKYYIYSLDPEIQVNIGILESILGEDLYLQILEQIGKYEMNGDLSLPITDFKIFKEIWNIIKAQLKLKEAIFDEDSFFLNEVKISLSPKANYFLAEDLAKLAKIPEEELNKTALTSWIVDQNLNTVSEIPEEKNLFFPFLYDKYQISTLSIIGNKASIIQGPPGTGKSETIANILCHLAANGNRILFVSQKAQALKVVKDKLKKLEVKYLFGYLPNPNSVQIGEDDESDGIAPQLSGLGSYIDNIVLRSVSNSKYARYLNKEQAEETISEVVDQRNQYKSELNSIIDKQRKFYKLSQELNSLKDYDFYISDTESFVKNFTSKEWNEIKTKKDQIESLSKIIGEFKKTEKKKKLDEAFSDFDFNGRHYSSIIQKIKFDVEKTGYDRHSSLARKLNNSYRNIRLSKIRKRLPREIVDYIDSILNKDISKNEAVKLLAALYEYCFYYENKDVLNITKNDLQDLFSKCGLSESEYNELVKITNELGIKEINKVKEKIIRVHEIKSELNQLALTKSSNKISSVINRFEDNRRERISIYIQNIVNKAIERKWREGPTMRRIIEKFAKAFGKSKKAFRTFDNLRNDLNSFNSILELIPIWIMELDDASRIIPLEAGIFDYVILDEASQCNVAYTLPAMYRAKRILFVGDSEQMRDSTIMFKSNRVFDELANRYRIPDDHQIKATGSAVQSVLDIAKNRGFMHKTLHYHYRSPKELIGFSNKYFYKPNGKDLIPLNNNYLTYKNSNRVMLIHQLDFNLSEEISDKVNVYEAKEILKLFKELRADDRYSEKSIGILTFFNAQATYIRELFEKDGLKEERDNYKISVVEGIQGDEKDIIIYSFVIRSKDQVKMYTPLTGEGGDIRADINKGRVNVAFSRARLQVHCFISLPIREFPEKIWLKKYLNYVQEEGEVDFYSTDLKQFDSYFEEEFYNLMRANFKKEYKIQNQVASCGFKIDFVVSNLKTGKKIAIECDGPTHFKDEIDEAYGIYVESDEERQAVLEAAGWNFCRIKYADWIDEKFNRNLVVKYVKSLIE